MHIDHSKLVELLTEASGLDASAVEEQLSELIIEINAAIGEGDAYEVTGLGVFSGIGNNIIFIPADEMATEINYKYVGMEPIEMDDPAADEASEPEDEPGAHEDDDPFAGILDEEDEAKEEPSETSASFELDVDDEEEAPLEGAESQDVEAFADEDAFEDPFEIAGQDVEEDIEEEVPPAPDEAGDEELEEKPGPDQWGIDSYKDDDDENKFSSLLGDAPESDEPEGQEEEDDFSSLFEDAEEEAGEEEGLADTLSQQPDEEVEEPDEPLKMEAEEDTEEEPFSPFADDGDEEEPEEEDEDFDDPFDALAEEDDEDAVDEFIEESEEDEDEEVVPVITNLASEETKKKRKEAEEESLDKKEPPSAADKKQAPVMLWVILIIVALSGGMYGLGYFGVLNIPGVTPAPEPQIAARQPVQQAQQPEQTTPQPAVQEPAVTPDPVENQPEEQPQQTPVSDTEQAAPEGQPTYGLNGVLVSAANDGYTIVIYSLSNEGNARAKQRELSRNGYRVLLAAIPSQQYGTLWRVSLGQFESLRTAAIAAEDLNSPFSENYFITKIQ